MDYRPIRKTAFMKYRKCPRQFEYFYNDADYFAYNEDELSANDALRHGSMFHKAADSFFTQLEGKKINEDKFRDLLPTGTDIDEWFDWFAEEEKKRYRQLVNTDMVGYFMPIAREIEIRTLNEDIPKTGHVDRIDVIPGTKNLCIVEYKTGKSYNMDNSYALTEMNAEMGFYLKIIEDANVFPNNKVITWKVINPTLKKIWVNQISPMTIRSVDKTYQTIIDKIKNKKEFERNIGRSCDFCPYIDDCLFKENEPLFSFEELFD